MSVHFVPGYDFAFFLKCSVNKSCRCRGEEGDLLSNEARHEDKTELDRVVDVERVFANHCCEQHVLAALVQAEGHFAGVKAEGSIGLE